MGWHRESDHTVRSWPSGSHGAALEWLIDANAHARSSQCIDVPDIRVQPNPGDLLAAKLIPQVNQNVHPHLRSRVTFCQCPAILPLARSCMELGQRLLHRLVADKGQFSRRVSNQEAFRE